MYINKCACLTALLCLIGAVAVLGQDGRFAPIKGPSTADPFTVGIGSYFSAGGGRPRSGGIRTETVTADFEEALSLIRQNYVGAASVRTDAITSSAITSMLKSLDPHSNFYDAAEFQELLGEHQSEYTGTGSSIAAFEMNGRIETFIVSVFPDSPAARAGLRFGDRIISVDGKPVSGGSPDFVRELVRGRRGTAARMTIERADTLAVETLELRRDRVHEPAVPKGFLLKAGVGYIDLTNGFSNATFPELETALSGLRRQGMTSLVLDLRGNGGGILEQAISVAERFLPAGSTIVSQRGRYSGDDRIWKSTKGAHEQMPMVILVDEDTASASEVLVGALQDNDRALVLGQKTFGKGLVQSVLNLPDGSGLTLTAARYYTPTGRSIQRDYADTGLYDYYNHRGSIEIDKAAYSARTLTGRIVRGGDGIMPDLVLKPERPSRTQVELIDALFMFSREYLNGRISPADSAAIPATKRVRQQMIFGENTVNDRLIEQFQAFTNSVKPGSLLNEHAAVEREFARDMLRYYISMGAFGLDAARRTKIEDDLEVRAAVAAIPESGRLAETALRARRNPRKQKGSLSLVLSEQR